MSKKELSDLKRKTAKPQSSESSGEFYTKLDLEASTGTNKSGFDNLSTKSTQANSHFQGGSSWGSSIGKENHGLVQKIVSEMINEDLRGEELSDEEINESIHTFYRSSEKE